MHMYCIWNWRLSQILTFIHVCTLYIQMAYSTVYESEDLAESAVSYTIYLHIVHEIFTMWCYTTVQYSFYTLSFCLQKWQHIMRKCKQQSSLPAIAWLSCLGSQDKAGTSGFYIGVHPESLYHCVRIWKPQPQIWVCVIWANRRLSTKSPVSPHAFHRGSHWGSFSCGAMSQPRC